jgi:hypothetical protein
MSSVLYVALSHGKDVYFKRIWRWRLYGVAPRLADHSHGPLLSRLRIAGMHGRHTLGEPLPLLTS